MSFRDKTFSTLKWSAIEKIGHFGVQLIISIVLARLLEPEVYGLIGIVMIFILIGSTIIDAGFSQGLIRKLDCTDEDYNSVFWFNLAVGCGLYAVLFFLAPYLARLFENPELCRISRVLFLFIPISSLNIVQVTKVNKELNFKPIAKYSVLASALSGIVGIVLAFMGYGVWALVFQSLTSATLLVIFFAKASDWRPRLKFSMKPIKELFPFSSMLFASAFLNTVFNNLYTFLIARWYTQSQLGYYTQANKFATQPTNLIEGILNRMVFPLLAQLQNDRPAYKNAYSQMQKTLFSFVLPMMVVLSLCSYEGFALVLGQKWLPSVPYFQIMCLAGIALPIHPLSSSTLKVFGKSRLIFKMEIAKKILIVGLIVLTFRFGIIGLVWSQLAYFWLALFMNMYYGGREQSYSLWEQLRDWLPYVTITAIAAGVAWLAGLLLDNMLLLLIVKMTIFVGIYLLLIIAFKLPEAEMLGKIYRKVARNDK